MTADDYTSDDAKAAVKLIYGELPPRKQAEMHSYLIDLVCYLTLTGERSSQERSKFALPADRARLGS